MNLKPVFFVNGILLLILSAAMLPPCLVDLINDSDDWQVFFSSGLIGAFFGFALIFMNRQPKFQLGLRETFLLISLSWIFMAGFGALPFCFSSIHLPYTAGFFEAMSGVTTTGSTVISGLDGLPHGILLWRAILEWIGGIGFSIMALAVLPMLQVAGMQIFRTQSFQIEKLMPSASQMITYTCIIYAGLTLMCAISLHLAGFTDFDAICHAMSALSTSGFSTADASVAHFANPVAEIILTVFMLIASLPFALYLRAGRGDWRALYCDSQIRTFFAIFAGFAAITVAWLYLGGQMSILDALRNALFLIASYMTTTGLANNDYAVWGHFVVGIAMVAIFIGGCSGSTAGGVKVFRLQLLFLMLRRQLRKLLTPHGIFHLEYNGKILEPTALGAVAAFFFVYVLSWLVISLLLQLTGVDFFAAFSGALAAISNTGVGTGEILGPAGNFASLPAPSLWVMSAAMLFGRVEFLSLLVVLTPSFWKT